MPQALVAPVIMAAGAIGGGLLASSGASKAANAQSQSDAAAIAEQQREFGITQQNFAPYLAAGKSALGSLGNLEGLNGNPAQQQAITALQNSPLYQSLYRNGLEANLQNASATGGLRGGNEQRGLADFGSDTLASVIQNQIGNLGGIAAMGDTSTGALGQLGQSNANSIASLIAQQGNARASGALTNAGIWSGVTNNLGSIFSSPAFLGAALGNNSGNYTHVMGF